jgi:hypothetical protein
VADHLAASGHPDRIRTWARSIEAVSRALGWDGDVLAELTLLMHRLGRRPPAEAEADHYAAIDPADRAGHTN